MPSRLSQSSFHLVRRASNSCPSPCDRSVEELIRLMDWKSFEKILSTTHHDFREALLAKKYDGSKISLTPENILHFVCRFSPPTAIIALIDELYPESTRTPDGVGRFPIHIASKWAASPSVIRYLARAYRDAAGMQDCSGKTPLHLACEYYMNKHFKSNEKDNVVAKRSMLDVVRILCAASPGTVNLEDDNEKTALEYAIDGDNDMKIIEYVQDSCVRCEKKAFIQARAARAC